MKQFVFIFRQHPIQLSEAEQKRRAEEVRAWALQQTAEGRKLDPKILTEEKHRVGQKSEGTVDGPVVVMVFLEANDFAEAVKIAETHPGLRYGVSIEVRGWTLPSAPAAPVNAQPSTIGQK